MESPEDEIQRLKAELEVVKVDRGKLKPSDSLYAEQKLAFTEDITAIRKQITALITSRQGKFASPISVVVSHSYR